MGGQGDEASNQGEPDHPGAEDGGSTSRGAFGGAAPHLLAAPGHLAAPGRRSVCDPYVLDQSTRHASPAAETGIALVSRAFTFRAKRAKRKPYLLPHRRFFAVQAQRQKLGAAAGFDEFI